MLGGKLDAIRYFDKILTARKLADVEIGECAKYCSSKCLVTVVNDNGQSDLRAGKCLGKAKMRDLRK